MRYLVLISLLLLGTVSPARAQTPQATGRVVGQVFNGTQGAAPGSVAGLTVSILQMGGSVGPSTRAAQTDAQGRFVLEGLDASSSSPFFVRVEYSGLKYFSDFLTFQGNPTVPVTLTVYEKTAVPADLRIDQMHLILDVAQNALQGTGLLVVSNPTDKVFLLPLPLPEGARSLNFEDPRAQARAQTLADGRMAMPIEPPGEQVLFGFILPMQPPEYELKVPLLYAVDSFNILVSRYQDLTVAGPQLAPGQPFVTTSGATYLRAGGTGFRAGQTITATLSNLPGGEAPQTTRNVMLVAGGLAALGLVLWPLMRRGQPAVEAEGDEPATHRVELLRAIAALDDAYEEDELDEDEYQAQRAELKAELIALAQGIGEPSGGEESEAATSNLPSSSFPKREGETPPPSIEGKGNGG